MNRQFPYFWNQTRYTDTVCVCVCVCVGGEWGERRRSKWLETCALRGLGQKSLVSLTLHMVLHKVGEREGGKDPPTPRINKDSLRSWRSCEKAENSMRRIRFLAPCWTNSKGGEKLEGRGWGRGQERPPACKLAFFISASLYRTIWPIGRRPSPSYQIAIEAWH